MFVNERARVGLARVSDSFKSIWYQVAKQRVAAAFHLACYCVGLPVRLDCRASSMQATSTEAAGGKL